MTPLHVYHLTNDTSYRSVRVNTELKMHCHGKKCMKWKEYMSEKKISNIHMKQQTRNTFSSIHWQKVKTWLHCSVVVVFFLQEHVFRDTQFGRYTNSPYLHWINKRSMLEYTASETMLMKTGLNITFYLTAVLCRLSVFILQKGFVHKVSKRNSSFRSMFAYCQQYNTTSSYHTFLF